MLVLSRKYNEKLVLPLIQTTIQVVSMKSGVVRLGVDAPSRVKVLREEIFKTREMEMADLGAMVLSREEKHAIFNQLNTVNLASTMLRTYLEKASGERSKAGTAVVDRLLAASEEITRLLNDAVQSPEPSNAPPAVMPMPTAVKSRRALLVEDDMNERELLAGLLQMQGMDVETAGDGEDALQRLSGNGPRFDLALIDMVLPKKDGLSTIREIRRDHSHDAMRIFAMTGHSRDEFPLDPAGDGIDEWLSKPLNPQKLLKDIASAR